MKYIIIIFLILVDLNSSPLDVKKSISNVKLIYGKSNINDFESIDTYGVSIGGDKMFETKVILGSEVGF